MATYDPTPQVIHRSGNIATRTFYSEERSGFVTTSQLGYNFVELVTDTRAAFKLRSFRITNSFNANANVLAFATNNYLTSDLTQHCDVSTFKLSDSKTLERIRTYNSGGIGYAVGALVRTSDTTVAINAEFRVTSVSSEGAVTGIELMKVESYLDNSGSRPTTSNSKATTYTSLSSTPIVNLEFTSNFSPWSNVTTSNGSVGINWDGISSLTGSIRASYNTSSPYNHNKIQVGMKAVCPSVPDFGERTVTGVVVRTLTGSSAGSNVYVSLDQPVTLSRTDEIFFRGSGLTIDDTESAIPLRYTAILETTGVINPPASAANTTATISGNTTNSIYVNVTNMQYGEGGGATPDIFEGQIVTGIPGITDDALKPVVVKVVNTAPGNANVTLSSAQSLTALTSLQFNFNPAFLQPWRLALDVKDPQLMNLYAGTFVQLQDNGSISRVTDFQGNVVDHSGIIGNIPTVTHYGITGMKSDVSVDINRPDQGFINRKQRVGDYPQAFPMNYVVTLTNRGMFFGVWEGSWSVINKSTSRFNNEVDNWFNWCLIQRPVDRVTGKVYTSGRAPVFCINSVGYKYWKFVVREADVLHPTQGDKEQESVTLVSGNVVVQTTPYRVPADQHTTDSFAVLNTTNQIALSEDSKYLVSFLHNLTTPRFRYSQELDMIGQTSADVCMAGNDVIITAYQESTQRYYRALPANKPYNSGLRVVVWRN